MTSAAGMAALLVFIRTSSFVTFLPPVAGQGIPVQAKVGLALGLACCWWPSAMAAAGGTTITSETVWWWLAWAGLMESLLGAGLAWVCGSVLTVAQTLGGVLADTIGLEMANVTNVLGTSSGTSLSQLFETLLAMLILTLNLHHGFVWLLHQSFQLFPTGSYSLSSLTEFDGIRWYTQLCELPILMGTPVLALTGSVLVLIAVSLKQVPQLNLMSYGMPLRVLCGMAALLMMLPLLLNRLMSFLQHCAERMQFGSLGT